MDLEAVVSQITQFKLRDFIKYIAGGVTPKITELEQYYSNSTDGIPFLRVQNLSPAGLCWSDCRYISIETHKGLLNRSKVFEGDLLIKITGVGRMAITSIAPKDFEGNINQHMVVVKTKNPQINDQIATFLNSDIGEMLASRRATGGTRPALDYKALRSIPIILNDTVSSIMQKAYTQKKEKENQAEALLNSINDYLLQELGIVMPSEEENTLERRMFYVYSAEVLGERFDPFYYKKEYRTLEDNIENCRYNSCILCSVAIFEKGVVYSADDEREQGHGILRANNIDLLTNQINLSDIRFIDDSLEISESKRLFANDILMCTASGSKEHAGKVAFIENDSPYYFGGFMSVIRTTTSDCISRYLFEYLASIIFKTLLYRHLGGTNINNVSTNMLNKIKVVLPPVSKQQEIADKIASIRYKVKILEQETVDVVNSAKTQVEKILLGGGL